MSGDKSFKFLNKWKIHAEKNIYVPMVLVVAQKAHSLLYLTAALS